MEALEASRRITEFLAAGSPGPTPRFRAWDGSEWGSPTADATLVLNHPAALRRLLGGRGDLSAGASYIFGDVDIEGDIVALLTFAAGMAGKLGVSDALALRSLLGHLPLLDRGRPALHRGRPARGPRLRGRRHSVDRDRQAIQYHYDTGNDFFSLFLDDRMVYSCAYFLSPDEGLATAQERKLDLICRKLDLQPGMRLLDVGCGWGALVIHAASHYGVDATGITPSGEQAAMARDLIERGGVADRARILQQDYRETVGCFDAIASIGMFEHVGRQQLPAYFSRLRGLLAPAGQVLNHGIVTHDRTSGRQGRSFVRTYVFPDGDIRPLDEVVGAALDSGFELRDLESLRPNYAHTLRHWVASLERQRDSAIGLAGDINYRIWRLYMAGSAVAFETAALGVVQMLLADPGRPWSYGRSGLLAADDRPERSGSPSRLLRDPS